MSTVTLNVDDTLPYRTCAGVMLANTSGQIFVGQRIDNATEAWQMPQGGIDKGEEPEEAALRELFEETGIALEHVSVIARSRDEHCYDLPTEMIGRLWKGKYRGQRQTWFLMRFHGQDSDIDIATETPEFSAWKWLEPELLPELIVPFKRKLYRDILDEFRDLI